jgi:DNA-binding CsgD family transcriptional regulator
MTAIYAEFDAGASRYRLTTREREVMWCVLAGQSTIEIADRLCLSSATVEAHVKSVSAKTSAGKRSASIARLLGIDAGNEAMQ